MHSSPIHVLCATLAAALVMSGLAVRASESDSPSSAPAPAERWAWHVQGTFVSQYHPAFASSYSGEHSLNARAEAKSTFDATLYAGWRPWSGAELWINPEIDQGFGLSDTLGVAGFPSGEAYKVGAHRPYGRVHRLFLRQTVDLGTDRSAVAADLNQLAGLQAADRLVITLGKFSAVDVFDINAYAHDPRGDFLNWSVIDGAAFDYAANAWGYTYGAVAEWYQGDWTARVGLFDLSVEPNSSALDPRVLPQYQLVAESERRYTLVGAPGTARALVFALHGRMGAYDAATTRARTTGGPADIAAVREGHTKYGVALNVQQQFLSDVGAFVRASAQQGDHEAFEFTDVARSVALGLSLAGARWQRAADTVGLALVGNQASAAARRYFAAGGLGILVGDGQLVHPGTEQIAEVYYRTALGKSAHVTVDYQVIRHPAYNRDRGPVSIVGLRLHAQQ